MRAKGVRGRRVRMGNGGLEDVGRGGDERRILRATHFGNISCFIGLDGVSMTRKGRGVGVADERKNSTFYRLI